MVLLVVSDLSCGYYRDVEILHSVSLKLEENSIASIIDPNGAGKSTILNTIFGFLSSKSGKISCDGEDISGMPPHVIKQKGVSYVTQVPSVFPQLTVEDNLLL